MTRYKYITTDDDENDEEVYLVANSDKEALEIAKKESNLIDGETGNAFVYKQNKDTGWDFISW